MAIKQLSASLLVGLFSIFYANAQNTYSPNSSLGLGEIVSTDNTRTAGMASVGIGIRNGSFLNTSNPAAISAIDSLTGIFDFGLYGKQSFYKSPTNGVNQDFVGNFNKIAFGFRLSKWWGFSLGIKPFSNVGYHIQQVVPVEGATSDKTVYMDGTGGLYNLYVTNAFNITPHLSVGVTSLMVSGSFTNSEDQTQYIYETRSRLTQFYNKFGVQYELPNMTFGVTYGYKQQTSVKNTFSIYSSSSTTPMSTENLRSTNQFIPQTVGVGFSYKRDKLLCAADAEWEQWNGLKSGIENVNIKDAYRLRLGLGYTPYNDLYTAHLAKQYQVGLTVNKSYIQVSNQAAYTCALSTGVVIPLYAGQAQQKAMIGLGLEYGRSISSPKGFVNDNYLMLNVNISFIEAMFIRRKIF